MRGPAAPVGWALALALVARLAEAAQPPEARRSGASREGSETLWQAPASSECRLRLVRLDGPVRVVVGRSTPRLLGQPGPWLVETNAVPGSAGEELQLTVHGPTTPAASTTATPSAETDRPPVVLEVPITCQLAIRTTGGAIEVQGPRLASLDARSTTGDVVLRVAQPDDAVVELATSGEITVDFSVLIDYVPHQEPAKRGRIGASPGGSWAKLSSLRGAIRVLKLPEKRSHSD